MMIEKFEANKVFFTSDTHFNHAKIIEYCNRPFSDVEDMNEVMIANWNRVVQPDGHVFHLGDFAMGGVEEWNPILDRLNGRIHLILGNHDLRTVGSDCPKGFEDVCMQKIIMIGKHQIILNHYPLLCYSGADKKTWQLFGHVHTNKNNIGSDAGRLQLLFPSQYDVGVDNNDYTPVSFEKIREVVIRAKEQQEPNVKLDKIPPRSEWMTVDEMRTLLKKENEEFYSNWHTYNK